MLSWMAGPAAAAEAEPAVAESTFIDLGKARWSHRFTTGLNAPVTPAIGAGLLFGYRMKRVTNYTFNDLRLVLVASPRLEDDEHDDSGPITWLGRVRVKTSTRNFDWKWLYAWARYEAKTSSDEDLNLRAAFSSGWGLFVWPLPEEKSNLRTNLEVGILVDYANLDAYSEGSANGYLWGGLSIDYEAGPLVYSLEGTSGLQLTDAELKLKGEDTQVDVNQTRVEIDASVDYHLNHFHLTVGSLAALYILQLVGEEGTPDTAVTVYAGFGWAPWED